MIKALDLFCGAGGAARGLQQAGFHVTGVDLKHQPRYCGDVFIQADAMTFPLDGYDLIWASPPCQAFTAMKTMWNAKPHLDLLTPTRARILASGIPYIIENVPGAPMSNYVMLCGTMFGLGLDGAELRRHRHFEVSEPPILRPPCAHGTSEAVIGVYGGHGRDRRRTSNTQHFATAERRIAMGIDWMSGAELSQAIPPAYSLFLARQFLAARHPATPPDLS